MRAIRIAPLLTIGILSLAQGVFAHPGTTAHAHSILDGAAHPLMGFDHILAMLAVGLWAAQRGGRQIWLMPAVFVGSMLAGGMMGALGVPMPAVESGIAASVLILGLAVATAAKLPAAPSLAMIGFFAVLHGHAHGTEITGGSAALYSLGFAASTALLHAAGIGLAATSRKAMAEGIIRVGGGSIAAAGLLMLLIG